ncbi:hypothetical protein ETAR_25030 [Edwardsiella tarda]|nr:hypothetical protein GBS0709_33050 [Edwardsiella tarda]GAC64905.1 hypothetical protein ET1_13_01910 [Edwardsiella tarda ATCC 15947 = NBRC 105688]
MPSSSPELRRVNPPLTVTPNLPEGWDTAFPATERRRNAWVANYTDSLSKRKDLSVILVSILGSVRRRATVSLKFPTLCHY